MRKRLFKSLFTFLLVLVLTVGTIAALSMATAAKTETATDRYTKELRATQPAVTELSAVIEKEQPSVWLSMGAFALILTVPAGGAFVYFRSGCNSGKKTEKSRPSGVRSFPSAVNR